MKRYRLWIVLALSGCAAPPAGPAVPDVPAARTAANEPPPAADEPPTVRGSVVRGAEADGDATAAAAGRPVAYIDLGAKHGVAHGDRYLVYELQQGGVRRAVGRLVVTQVLDDLAQCEVEELFAADPPVLRGQFVERLGTK